MPCPSARQAGGQGADVKPEEARRRRKLIETAKAARGDRLELMLQGKKPIDVVDREAIPTEDDLERQKREFKKITRRLAKTNKLTNRGRYNDYLDELMVCLARIVFIERVLERDPIERASLTVAQVVALSAITPGQLSARLARLRGETGIVVPS